MRRKILQLIRELEEEKERQKKDMIERACITDVHGVLMSAGIQSGIDIAIDKIMAMNLSGQKKMNSDQNVQVSDTTEGDSSKEAGTQK